MELTHKIRRQLQLQSWSFVILFIGVLALLATLSQRYSVKLDWTAAGRHTLSAATTELLQKMEGKVEVTAFTRAVDENPLSRQIREVIERYQQVKSDITLQFVDPDQEPARVRELGIKMDGELVVRYREKQEQLQTVGEQALTNALQRLLRSGEREVVWITGHGERSFKGDANHDLREWSSRLQQKGFKFREQNLSLDLNLSDQGALVVLASPRTELLSGEVEALLRYLDRGGHLLWLRDPEDSVLLPQLSSRLGVEWQAGTLVDPTGQMLGIPNPAIILVAEYPIHPITTDLGAMTLFPFAQAVDPAADRQGWQATPILQSLDRSWLERGELKGSISFDEGIDRLGPQTIALALTRPKPAAATAIATATATATATDPATKPAEPTPPAGEQRVVVVADGDFLSNAYLGNGANQDLGDRLLNWLAHDDALITLPARVAPDVKLELSPLAVGLISYGFLIVVPLSLLLAGGLIWWRRRKG